MPPEQNEATTATVTEAEQTPTTEETSVEAPKAKNKKFVYIVLALAALGLGYLIFFTDFFAQPPATVNGVAISQTEYDNSIKNVTNELTTQGYDTSTEQAQSLIADDALNRLINTELLLQAATKAGYTEDTAAVDEQVEALTVQYGGAENLQEHLAGLGLDEKMMREDVAEQLIVEAYLTNETGITEVSVSDEDVINFYNSLRDQYGDQLPDLDEIRTQVEADLMGQKQQQLLSEVLATLRTEASIIIN